MSEDQLRKDLEVLRAERDRLGSMAGPSRERLNRLIADVERRLDQAEEDETLVERLREDLTHFEVEHPALAAGIETILNTLSNAGI
jgi:GAF domain-containing protein